MPYQNVAATAAAAACKLQVAVVIVAENVDKMEHVASTTWQQLWPMLLLLIALD